MANKLGWLLGIDSTATIESIQLSLAASWARSMPWLVAFLLLLAVAAAGGLYARRQNVRSPVLRWSLALLRAMSLVLLTAALAEPQLVVHLARPIRPLLWLVLDGTDSMNIVDRLGKDEQQALQVAVAGNEQPESSAEPGPAGPGSARLPAAGEAWRSRADWVRAWLRKRRDNDLAALAARFRVKAFLMDRAEGVRMLELPEAGDGTATPSTNDPSSLDTDLLASALKPRAPVTAIGQTLLELATRHSVANLAGVVLISDFGQNSGPAPLAAARQLQRPLYTVGVGPAAAINLAVDMQPPPKLKRAEMTRIPLTVRQTGLDGHVARLTLSLHRVDSSRAATPLDQDASSALEPESHRVATRPAEYVGGRIIDQRDLALDGPATLLEIPFAPDEAGDFRLVAEVEQHVAEVIGQDNVAARAVHVLDDYMRLFFVEYEPTWEWRFIKEVFHRDPMVGMRGFRTYLRSADPGVRTTNALFAPSMVPPRSEFFASDVIVLGDLPATALTPRFCESVREFVEKFGGGLVVLSGPRFGPSQLASTPIADMLPVMLDGGPKSAVTGEFRLQLTAEALLTDFMQLGGSASDSRRCWEQLGPLFWYQPVARPHSQATILAQHPTDRCADGSPQPLIAIRQFGARGGQVVYLGCNETWRLRRKHGERYFRQFWGQMIHRLSLSHALGSQKRFVIRTDRPQYQPGDEVTISAEVYDLNFEPLTADQLTGRSLTAALLPPDVGGQPVPEEALPLAESRPGLFTAAVRPINDGVYRLRVTDPLTDEVSEVRFQVAQVSIERASATRNVALQEQLARESGGRSYDLTTVHQLARDIDAPTPQEHTDLVLPLWHSWLIFGLVVALLLGEWGLRKWAQLP